MKYMAINDNKRKDGEHCMDYSLFDLVKKKILSSIRNSMNAITSHFALFFKIPFVHFHWGKEENNPSYYYFFSSLHVVSIEKNWNRILPRLSSPILVMEN